MEKIIKEVYYEINWSVIASEAEQSHRVKNFGKGLTRLLRLQ
jgi:hypothetical protein